MPPPPPPPPPAACPAAAVAWDNFHAPPHEALSTGAANVDEHEALMAALLDDPAAPLHPAFASPADLRGLIRRLPKAELHIHIEGALSPELMVELARRNGVAVPHADAAAAHAARANFAGLPDFLDEFVRCAAVLRTEADYHRLGAAYLARAAAEHVRAAEIFVDAHSGATR